MAVSGFSECYLLPVRNIKRQILLNPRGPIGLVVNAGGSGELIRDTQLIEQVQGAEDRIDTTLHVITNQPSS